MRRLPLAALVFLVAGVARADAPADPLRLLPDAVDLVLKVENPRQFLDAVHYYDLLKQLQTIPAVREQFDSTNVRRLLQLLAHYERELGADRYELLDRLGGGGVALGVKFGKDPAPALLVVQARDEAALRKFVAVTLELTEAELARQEAKESIKKEKYRDIEVVQTGKDAYLAVVGSALLISNQTKAMKAAIDLHHDGGKKSLAGAARVVEARKLLPADALAWGCLNLETTLHPAIKGQVGANLVGIVGGWFDVARRSSFVAAGFTVGNGGYRLSIRMPKGRNGMAEETAVHMPPDGQPGSRPLLELPNTLASLSYYQDLAMAWKHRAKLLPDEALKGLEDVDKKVAPALAGGSLDQFLSQLAPYQRVIIVAQENHGYKTQPNQPLPAFAVVLEMREPDKFTRVTEGLLRTGAIALSTQLKMRLAEEERGDRRIVGYRFVEGESLPGDPNNLRFNFSPCFVRVGNQFVACSTVELCRDLVDLLEKEAKSPPPSDPSPGRTRLYGTGAVSLLRAAEDQLVAQTVLGEAVSPDAARQQVRALVELAKQLGIVNVQTQYGERDFRFDVSYAPQRHKEHKAEKR